MRKALHKKFRNVLRNYTYKKLRHFFIGAFIIQIVVVLNLPLRSNGLNRLVLLYLELTAAVHFLPHSTVCYCENAFV